MIGKLSERDIRAVKLGGICAAAILLSMLATEWLRYWVEVRKSLFAAREQLKAISPSRAKQEGLWSVVPVFEIPQEEESQMLQFRDKLSEQLKKAGIESEPLLFLPGKKSWEGNYNVRYLQCRRGKCNFGQVLDLLVRLKENPYLVAIEEFEIKCKPEKRQEFELNLKVSTFVK